MIMRRKHSNLLFLTAVILIVFPLFACGNDRESRAIFNSTEVSVQPGYTAELLLNISFIDSEPRRTEIKSFKDESPVVAVSNPGFRLLSAEPSADSSGIQCRIIIRASEDLLSGDSTEIAAQWAGLKASALVKVRKNPSARIDSAGVVTDPAAYDVFVNKQRRMPADYIPSDLVRIEVPTILTFEEVNHLRRAASEALSAMFAAAEDEHGYELLARSGYRAYKTQVMLYDANVREHGEEYASRFSAKPGTSEHQTGLAMDISSPVVNYQLEQEFGKTAEGRWTAENAHRFGFIIRYPEGKEDLTGYSYEPWHLRYVGKALADEIYKKNLTLEEYYSKLQ